MHLIYSCELESKDTTDTRTTASYLNLFLNIDTDFTLKSMKNGMMQTSQLTISHFSAVTYHMILRMFLPFLNLYVLLVFVHTILTSYTGVCSNRVLMRKD